MGRVFLACPEFGDVRGANINVVGNWLTPMLGDLNRRAISLVEAREAVN